MAQEQAVCYDSPGLKYIFEIDNPLPSPTGSMILRLVSITKPCFMKGVEFKELDLLADGEKGQLFEFDNRKTTDRFILIKRKAGIVSGCDYHKGKHPNKNPEIGILISGTAEFYCKNSKSEEVTKVFDKPIMFIFHKNIYHEVRAITDILFIEFSAATDGKGDSFKIFPDHP